MARIMKSDAQERALTQINDDLKWLKKLNAIKDEASVQIKYGKKMVKAESDEQNERILQLIRNGLVADIKLLSKRNRIELEKSDCRIMEDSIGVEKDVVLEDNPQEKEEVLVQEAENTEKVVAEPVEPAEPEKVEEVSNPVLNIEEGEAEFDEDFEEATESNEETAGTY